MLRSLLARRPRLLDRGILALRSVLVGTRLASATAATLPATPSYTLSVRLRRGLLLWRALRLLAIAMLRALLRTLLRALLRSLRTTVAATLALRLLRPSLGTRRASTAARAALVLLPRPLLELLHLPLHVLADRSILTGPHLVETAVRTAFPTFGVGLPAGAAKNAFRQRHCRAGRIVHFRPWTPGTTRRAAKRC